MESLLQAIAALTLQVQLLSAEVEELKQVEPVTIELPELSQDPAIRGQLGDMYVECRKTTVDNIRCWQSDLNILRGSKEIYIESINLKL